MKWKIRNETDCKMPPNTTSLLTGVCPTQTTQTKTYSHVRHLHTTNNPLSTKGDGQKTFPDPSPIFHLDKNQNGQEPSENPVQMIDWSAFRQTQENGQTDLESDRATYSPVIKGTKIGWIDENLAKNVNKNRSVRPSWAELDKTSSGTKDASSTAHMDNETRIKSTESPNEANDYKCKRFDALSRTTSPAVSTYPYNAYYPTPGTHLCRKHGNSFGVRNLRAEFDAVHDKKDRKMKDTISWIHSGHEASFPGHSSGFYDEFDGMPAEESKFPQWLTPDDLRYSRLSKSGKIRKRHLPTKSFIHSTPIHGVETCKPADGHGESSGSPTQRISLEDSTKNVRKGPAVRASPLIKGSKKWWRTPGYSVVNGRSPRRPPSWAELETQTEDMSTTVDVSHVSHFNYDDFMKLRKDYWMHPMADYLRGIPCKERHDAWISWVHDFQHSTPKPCRHRIKSFRNKCSEPESHFRSEDGNSFVEQVPPYLPGTDSSLMSGTLPSSLCDGSCSFDSVGGESDIFKCTQPFARDGTTSDDHEMCRKYLETKPFAHFSPVRDHNGQYTLLNEECSCDVSKTDGNVRDPRRKAGPIAQSTPVPEDSRIPTKCGLCEDLEHDMIRSSSKKTNPFEHSTPLRKSTDGNVHELNRKVGPLAQSTPVPKDSRTSIKCELCEDLMCDAIFNSGVKANPFVHSTPKSTKHQEFHTSSERTAQLGTTTGTGGISWKYHRTGRASPIVKDRRRKTPGICQHSVRERHPSRQRTPLRQVESKDTTEDQTTSKHVQAGREEDDSKAGQFEFGKYIATLMKVAGKGEDTERSKGFNFGDYRKRLHSLIHNSERKRR